MKQFTRRVRQVRRAFFDIRTLVAIAGLLLSVVLHELFHGILHWGSISSIRLFPNSSAIVEITSTTKIGYSTQFEEAIAYTITFITLLVTAVIIAKMSDKKDTRSFLQTVFPRDARMQAMTAEELYRLALQAKVF
jgi:hypothetical protein